MNIDSPHPTPFIPKVKESSLVSPQGRMDAAIGPLQEPDLDPVLEEYL